MVTPAPHQVGMSWTSLPPKATFSTCSPRQMARTGPRAGAAPPFGPNLPTFAPKRIEKPGEMVYAMGVRQREEKESMIVQKIVITGGPCAGKTTAMSWIANNLPNKG